LRDYLFIPLGGSRGEDCPACQRRRTNRNLLITMALGGLWHGASWTFVAWGVLHGLLLVGHRSFRGFCERRPTLKGLLATPPGTALRVAVTFLAVCAGWVLFRSTTFGGAALLLRRLVIPTNGLTCPLPTMSFWCLAAVTALCHGLGRKGLWKSL